MFDVVPDVTSKGGFAVAFQSVCPHNSCCMLGEGKESLKNKTLYAATSNKAKFTEINIY